MVVRQPWRSNRLGCPLLPCFVRSPNAGPFLDGTAAAASTARAPPVPIGASSRGAVSASRSATRPTTAGPFAALIRSGMIMSAVGPSSSISAASKSPKCCPASSGQVPLCRSPYRRRAGLCGIHAHHGESAGAPSAIMGHGPCRSPSACPRARRVSTRSLPTCCIVGSPRVGGAGGWRIADLVHPAARPARRHQPAGTVRLRQDEASSARRWRWESRCRPAPARPRQSVPWMPPSLGRRIPPGAPPGCRCRQSRSPAIQPVDQRAKREGAIDTAPRNDDIRRLPPARRRSESSPRYAFALTSVSGSRDPENCSVVPTAQVDRRSARHRRQ